MSDFIDKKKTDYEGLFTSDCGRSSHEFPWEDLHFSGLNGTFPLIGFVIINEPSSSDTGVTADIREQIFPVVLFNKSWSISDVIFGIYHIDKSLENTCNG